MIQFDVDDAPTLSEIARAQTAVRKSDISTHKLHFDSTGHAVGVYVDAAGRIFVPDSHHLRLRLCIVAHQGLGGHRGSETTAQWLTSRFTWPGIQSDIRTLCLGCLHCLRTKGGKTIPRPRQHIPAAHSPNEVVHFDYIFIRKSSSEPQYVLTIIDGFSRFVWFTPHHSPNAENTARALLQWFGLFGIVKSWVSDQGSHFLNCVVDHLRELLGANHRFTTAYAPWSNGLVERVGKTLKGTLSALISETKRRPEDWPLFLPVVNNIINHSPSSALGDRCPITAFTGRKADSPLDVIFSPTGAERLPLSVDDVKSRIAALEAELDAVVHNVSSISPRKHGHRPGTTPVDFSVGDYVLVARSLHGARDKTAPVWGGPGLVVSAENDLSFNVRDLVTGKERVIHAEHLKRYADSSLRVTPQLKSFIAASAIQTNIEAFVGHRKVKNIWKLRVKWLGFDDEEDDTWEDFAKMCQAVPATVKRYVKSIQDPSIRTELSALASLACANAKLDA